MAFAHRDVLDHLVLAVIEKETLHRTDLERIFATVVQRPRITTFHLAYLREFDHSK